MPGLTTDPGKRRPRVEQRLADVESWLASGMSHPQIERRAAAEWGIGRRHVRRYLRVTYGRWAKEAALGDREHRRAHVRALALATMRRALERTKAITVAIGEGVQELRQVPDPDSSAAGRMVDLLAKIEGMTGEASSTVNVTVVGDSAISALRAFYMGTAPAPALPAQSGVQTLSASQGRTEGLAQVLDVEGETVPRG